MEYQQIKVLTDNKKINGYYEVLIGLSIVLTLFLIVLYLHVDWMHQFAKTRWVILLTIASLALFMAIFVEHLCDSIRIEKELERLNYRNMNRLANPLDNQAFKLMISLMKHPILAPRFHY